MYFLVKYFHNHQKIQNLIKNSENITRDNKIKKMFMKKLTFDHFFPDIQTQRQLLSLKMVSLSVLDKSWEG